MTEIAPDRRRIEAEHDPEGERLAEELAAAYVELRLRMARVLDRLDRKRTYHLSSCSSIVQYAVRLGVPFAEARAIVDLGRTIRVTDEARAAGAPATPGVPSAGPSIEDRVRAGTLPVDNASAAARIVAVPGYAKPGEDWIARAESLPVPAFRHAVRARIEEMAQGVDHVVPVTAHVSERTRDDFHRAGVIASREAGVRLTPGQTFTLVVRSYLESHDDSRPVGPSASRSERTRDCETSGPEAPLPIAGTLRSGPGGGGRETADPPDGAVTDVATAPVAPGAARRVRAIPADVRREVLSRSADRCEVPGCPHDTFLEYAHILAHASGGGRDAPNLLRLCHAHHVQFDAGYLVFCGWRPDEDHARPTFSDARGDPIGTVRRAGAPDVAGAVERTSPDVPAPTANPCAYAPEPACPARPADVPESDRPSAGILDVAIAAEELASIGEDVGGPIMEEPRGEPGDDWCVAECTPTWGLPDFADPPNPP